MEEWLGAFKTLLPALGPAGTLLVIFLVITRRDLEAERKAHDLTRKSLNEMSEKRVSEAMTLTKVVEASSASSDARSESIRAQNAVLDRVVSAIAGLQTTIIDLIARVAGLSR